MIFGVLKEHYVYVNKKKHGVDRNLKKTPNTDVVFPYSAKHDIYTLLYSRSLQLFFNIYIFLLSLLIRLDQHRSGILQQKPLLQSPQQFQQLQFLTPQQQLLLQTHQNMASLPANDVETRRLWMLHNNKNMTIHLDGQINNNSGHIIPNIGSPDQIGGSRNKIDMLIAVCSMTSYLGNASFLLILLILEIYVLVTFPIKALMLLVSYFLDVA